MSPSRLRPYRVMRGNGAHRHVLAAVRQLLEPLLLHPLSDDGPAAKASPHPEILTNGDIISRDAAVEGGAQHKEGVEGHAAVEGDIRGRAEEQAPLCRREGKEREGRGGEGGCLRAMAKKQALLGVKLV